MDMDFLLSYITLHGDVECRITDHRFKPYLKDESITSPDKVERVLLCTGKVFYELKEERQKRSLASKIAISRVEQLFPFPYGEVVEDMKLYPNAELFWAQEEHRNQGWWHFVHPRLLTVLGRNVNYCGRSSAATPSTGNKLQHQKELEYFMNQCFSGLR